MKHFIKYLLWLIVLFIVGFSITAFMGIRQAERQNIQKHNEQVRKLNSKIASINKADSSQSTSQKSVSSSSIKKQSYQVSKKKGVQQVDFKTNPKTAVKYVGSVMMTNRGTSKKAIQTYNKALLSLKQIKDQRALYETLKTYIPTITAKTTLENAVKSSLTNVESDIDNHYRITKTANNLRIAKLEAQRDKAINSVASKQQSASSSSVAKPSPQASSSSHKPVPDVSKPVTGKESSTPVKASVKQVNKTVSANKPAVKTTPSSPYKYIFHTVQRTDYDSIQSVIGLGASANNSIGRYNGDNGQIALFFHNNFNHYNLIYQFNSGDKLLIDNEVWTVKYRTSPLSDYKSLDYLNDGTSFIQTCYNNSGSLDIYVIISKG